MINYLFSKRSANYDRDNYDSFLKKVSFSYKVPSIHIAGTNGKGQTASFIASIYKEAGYKVGIYTSPYFKLPNETIKINDDEIPLNLFESYIIKYKKFFDKYDLTEFEIVTFIALTYFQDKKCDIAIIECGMGGEIDATNVFDPILSIITSVSMEHTSVLGRSLGEIAEHKAGIIKEEVPVLIDEFDQEVVSTIAERADYLNSKIELVGKTHNVYLKEDGYHFDYYIYEDLIIKRKSLASLKDATFAIEAVTLLKDKFFVSEEHIKGGLIKNYIPARMEIVSNNPLIIIDGAHNPEACRFLVKDIENICDGKNIHIVFASFKDKNISSMFSHLSTLTNDLYLTEFDHDRCRRQDDYFLYLDEYKYFQDYKELIRKLISEYPEDLILVTGSLAFALLVSDDFAKGEFNHE